MNQGFLRWDETARQNSVISLWRRVISLIERPYRSFGIADDACYPAVTGLRHPADTPGTEQIIKYG